METAQFEAEVYQWDGTPKVDRSKMPPWVVQAAANRELIIDGEYYILVVSKFGTTRLNKGDYLVKLPHGDFLPCSPKMYQGMFK